MPPGAALAEGPFEHQLDEDNCIPITDPDTGEHLGAIAPTRALRMLDATIAVGYQPAIQRMRQGAEALGVREDVIEGMAQDLQRDMDNNLPIPLFDPLTGRQHGDLEVVAFPADLPEDFEDPDATMARVVQVAVQPDHSVRVNLEVNPYRLLTNAGTETIARWPTWNVTFRAANFTIGGYARMWATSTATTINDTVWTKWSTGTAGTGQLLQTQISENVWTQWVNATATTPTNVATPLVAGTGYYQRPQTDEQAAAERAKYAEMEKERAEAEVRATELLRSALDDEQEAEMLTHARFHVVSQKGRKYRIRKGWSHSVDLIEGDKIKGTYCIHPRERVPEQDSMLAQKLMLETMEDEFLRIANYSAAWGERRA